MELVFIGVDLKEYQLRLALDACLMDIDQDVCIQDLTSSCLLDVDHVYARMGDDKQEDLLFPVDPPHTHTHTQDTHSAHNVSHKEEEIKEDRIQEIVKRMKEIEGVQGELSEGLIEEANALSDEYVSLRGTLESKSIP